ncbi:MAG: type sorting protein [Bacteroidetes bacterium]|jgi:subtilisin family serine protease|nr:type sorting protein [Bacteroidota bacterium]MDF2450384.1 type sorting protein [Bacteroidota bacterium]
MKPAFHFIVFLLLCFLATAQKTYQLPASIVADDYMPKTIIIKVKPQFASVCSVNHIDHSAFTSLSTLIGVTNLHKKFPFEKSPVATKNEAGQAYADLSLIYELNYTTDLTIEKAISKLLLSNILVYAEPHFIPKPNYSPNDPLANSSSQYHLQTINAFNAWDLNRGDSAIVIGITDTGTDFTHPDLFNNVKRNYADVVDGIDNDGDNYTDNYLGWDMGMNDRDASWETNAHGVHVCGLASASADNSLGGAGVGFHCKFLPVKISNASGALIAAYEGIKYAADHGCQIINCSWGGGGSSQFGQDIIDYATINKNCLVVCAAGNNNADGDFFPAAYNYVLSVGNTTISDTKQGSSNYGYMVDVCAPGDNVNSTWPGSLYITSSGTSMSSPIVAGAAGIVKNHFPAYNGLQVGERLKITSDDIYALNPSYLNKLGNGRINLFRALNDPSSPSVVMTNKTVTDHNDLSFINGDTLFIAGTFINYLDPTSALNVTVTPLSVYATALDNVTSLGAINTLAIATNSLDPFTFKLTGSIPINQSIDFEVLMNDGTYQAKQFFTLFINVDYINIDINDVSTTATSKGKIGYNQDAQVQGLGFKYNSVELLYEGGLMVGRDTTKVSDCVRGLNPSAGDIDFSTVNRIALQIPSVTSDFDTKARMNDNLSVSPIPVNIAQNTYAWATVPNTQFVIWEYVLTNSHATDTIQKLYAGIFADWDIDGGTFAQNRSAYDVGTKMGYSYYTASGGKYAGIKLLTGTAPPNFYAIDHVSGGNGGLDVANGFDTREKYLSLSTQRLAAGVSGTGTDVINVMSSGPFKLAPGDSVKVAFALIGGDSLANLITGAQQAQIKYDGLITKLNESVLSNSNWKLYPNPAKNSTTISQTEAIFHQYEIYDVNGRRIDENKIQGLLQTLDLSGFSEGMYIMKLIGNRKVEFKKIVVAE